MYGTVAKLRLQPGSLNQLKEQMEEMRGLDVPGFIGMSVFLTNQAANEIHMSVVFESKAAYDKNADSPEQSARFEKMAELFQSEPEWHDGEVIFHQ